MYGVSGLCSARFRAWSCSARWRSGTGTLHTRPSYPDTLHPMPWTLTPGPGGARLLDRQDGDGHPGQVMREPLVSLVSLSPTHAQEEEASTLHPRPSYPHTLDPMPWTLPPGPGGARLLDRQEGDGHPGQVMREPPYGRCLDPPPAHQSPTPPQHATVCAEGAPLVSPSLSLSLSLSNPQP